MNFILSTGYKAEHNMQVQLDALMEEACLLTSCGNFCLLCPLTSIARFEHPTHPGQNVHVSHVRVVFRSQIDEA